MTDKRRSNSDSIDRGHNAACHGNTLLDNESAIRIKPTDMPVSSGTAIGSSVVATRGWSFVGLGGVDQAWAPPSLSVLLITPPCVLESLLSFEFLEPPWLVAERAGIAGRGPMVIVREKVVGMPSSTIFPEPSDSQLLFPTEPPPGLIGELFVSGPDRGAV